MNLPKLATALTAVLAITSAGVATAQAPAMPPGKGSISLVPPKDAPPIVGAKLGPYATTIESNPTLASHTIYRPADLAAFNGAKRLPIIAWGNGACSNAGLLFQTFLSSLASNGFVLIASGPKDAPLPAFATGKGPDTGAADFKIPPAMTKDADMQTAINWAIAENEKKGSPYYHHLDPSKIAVMGQSCGGLQTIANAGDPRVKTAIVWNSGTFPDGGNPAGQSLSGATKASLAKFHTPVAYINGGPADAAYWNARDDIEKIGAKVPVFHAYVGVGHGGTYNHPNGGRFTPAGLAWLNWQLNGDKEAAKQFVGKDCGLCKDPAWHVEKFIP